MAGRKLARNVFVAGRLFLADSEPPKEFADQISNPNAWAGGSKEKSEGSKPDAQKADGSGSEAKKLGDHTVPELQAEIDKRNEGREEDAKIQVGGKGNKADLVKALKADDAAK